MLTETALSALVLDCQHQVLMPFPTGDCLEDLIKASGIELPPPVGVAPPLFAFLTNTSTPSVPNRRWVPLCEATKEPAVWETYTSLLLGGYRPPSRQLDVFSFGNEPFMAARLAHLVVKGKKRATSGNVTALEKLNLTIPTPGLVSIVTDGFGIPLCCIQTERVDRRKFRDVPREVAIGEGEGDLSLADWRHGHGEYFTKEATRLGLSFDEESEILTEWFKVLKVFDATR